ncbi:hypothetical protein MKX01_035094 [Papaver californicum]|nr:hypothetical protein MKX01_035094 [Papaver californicum]
MKSPKSTYSCVAKEKVDCESYNSASPGDLNYPSFSVLFRNNTVTYKRVVKNVGSSINAVYEARVYGPSSIKISVLPSNLVFSEAAQSLSYEITFSSLIIEVLGSTKAEFGAIEWSDGVHVVRSPIAFRWE